MRFTKKSQASVILMLTVVALSGAILACGSDTPEARPGGTDSQIDSPAAAATDKPLGSARSNPAPPGFEVSLGEITIYVGEIIRPATSIVMAGNMFNTEPEAGQEYIFVEVFVQCDKGSDDTCSIYSMGLELIASSGISYDSEMFVTGVDNLLDAGEFYGGATISGYIPFIVDVDDVDLILKYEELFGGEAYLALE